jgi:predicted O-methyltransferase YrrM
MLQQYLQKLQLLSKDRKIPNISPENAAFLRELVRQRNPKNLLEIGTANGYSTLQFASVLSDDATITTIEYAWNAHIEAVEHFKNCKIKNIHAIYGDAKRVIPTLWDGCFDLIFIDAMKREYVCYLEQILPKCTPNALIIIDDVEKFKDKMSNLYLWLDSRGITYKIEKTDADDSIMILEYVQIEKKLRMKP